MKAANTTTANRETVRRFWLQPTTTFPEGAPQRESYVGDCSPRSPSQSSQSGPRLLMSDMAHRRPRT